jgi:hypothetical protein
LKMKPSLKAPGEQWLEAFFPFLQRGKLGDMAVT